jgi:hypothetical protein
LQEPVPDPDTVDFEEKGGDYATDLLNSNRIQLTKDELVHIESQFEDMPLDKANKVGVAVLWQHCTNPGP